MGTMAIARKELLSEERRRAILAIIRRDGRAVVGDLAEMFATSSITIRKDLEYLHRKGLIHRTHGGALPVASGALEDLTLHEKEKLHHDEKVRIAKAAVEMIKEGQCIILDSGTTTTAIARVLRSQPIRHLTVITNAVNIAATLAGTEFEVVLTGGTLRKNSFSLVGPHAADIMREISADVLFLGMDGFDPKSGLYTPNMLEARVNRAMVEAAKKVVAVCDSSKFGRRSLSLIVPAAAVHHVITDKKLSRPMQRELREIGIELTMV